MTKNVSKEYIDFWQWLFKNPFGKAGINHLFDYWLFGHVFIGLMFAFIISKPLDEAANSVFIPLIGLLIGLIFALAGNYQALLQTEEIQEMTEQHPGGFGEYVFLNQLAILIVLITIIIWVFAGLSIFDKFWPKQDNCTIYFIIKFLLFFFTSITVRECWHSIIAVHWLLRMQIVIKKNKET